MTKYRLQNCRSCRIETWHRVKKVCFKPHHGGSGGVKYTMEHCTKCNKRWYDGKLKGQIIEKKKQPRRISLR